MASSTRLFVGNLPEKVNENDLQSAFSCYGDITNIDIKCKPDVESDKKRFAFITLSTTEHKIDSCLKHFSNESFHGNILYVTKARESFLERLQREREQAQKKSTEIEVPSHNENISRTDNFFKENRANKRKFLNEEDINNDVNLPSKKIMKPKYEQQHFKDSNQRQNNENVPTKPEIGNKKYESEQKRLESMKKKRQEFKEKKLIIKTGLTGIDKVSNKKIIFSDTGDDYISKSSETDNINGSTTKATLFDEDGSDDDINFEIKQQFEGKKGQKVLDLQSRYKSDRRFVLDERFAEDSNEEDETSEKKDEGNDDEAVELEQADEKSKQVKILQDLLGVTIRSKQQEPSAKAKAKLGMLRFDPLQPDHAKFLAPIEPKQELTKKTKKKCQKEKEEVLEPEPIPEVPKVEVSKEQFYEVSDALKETIAQPTSFSLRNLFSKNIPTEEDAQNEIHQSIPIQKPKDKKVKNPLDPGEKNPFVYDSSDSEDEDEIVNKKQDVPEKVEVKAVWRENLFLSQFDNRLKEGLAFFNNPIEGEIPKERRQLKSVMKKRLYNKERKNKMFKKKIGGRKKNMKKSYNKKS